MECRVTDLRYKELIDIRDGARYGCVGDVELDTATGRVKALVVYGRLRLFGLLGREEDAVIPWSAVKRFGEDIILVETDPAAARGALRGKTERKFLF